ncbi:PadR family transcriptional regulator [Leptospira mtsangambouensis]|uniref:PadR family transcriptional regulator n=1 Tax=Leptospira mtsangambouensis TaxID=2484912 RepID=A0ABY2NWJ8_9LEPT|nr:PadR family transcriptional regulator [Leptospira mtsangambouensis]TGM72838.1 PadR family transcriptional regulator [Leptospira mtsangambouensis]
MRINEFFSSFIKIHILHHCEKEEIYGVWMIKELNEHGYKISPGSLYPMLKNLEEKKLIRSRVEQIGKVKRKFYRITPKGKNELSSAKVKLKELIGEILYQ